MARKKKKRTRKKSGLPLGNLSVEEFRENGEQYLRQKKFQNAIKCFKEILKNGDDSAVVSLLAQAYRGRAREFAAKSMLKEALVLLDAMEQRCGIQDAGSFRILLLLKAGNYSQAVHLFNECRDVSVVQIEDDVIEVIASHGNNALGGDDFDGLIERNLIERIKEEEGITEISRQAQARIRRGAEDAKKHLSSHPFVSVEEEYLLEDDSVPYHLRVELSRREYEEMITPLVDETMDAVHLVLHDAQLTASDIDEVLLVGGSTRTPLVQQRLEKEFGTPPRYELDPDLCVAGGAAL